MDREKFLEEIYKSSEEGLKEVYKEQEENKENILKEIAMALDDRLVGADTAGHIVGLDGQDLLYLIRFILHCRYYILRTSKIHDFHF